MPIEKILTHRKGPFYIMWWTKKKPQNDQDWDRPLLTVGISGMRENFSRDRGIKEPFWEPSMEASDFENAPSKEDICRLNKP